MIFNLNYSDYENNFRDFIITSKKKISKNEKLFFRYLFENYSKQKEYFLEIEEKNLLKLLCLSSNEELIKYLDKFLNLKIYYSFKDDENNLYQGAFNILNSYFIQKNKIIFILSKEVLLSFDKNNFFNKVNLKTIFDFKYSLSLIIYLKLLATKKDEGSIEFSLDELKKMLEVENSYDRFYDFERKVITPIINDLNCFSKYKITYFKKKCGCFKSSKVSGIKFQYINKNLKILKNSTNDIINLIKDSIIDFNVVYEAILDNLKKHNFDYVKKNILFAKTNYSDNFDEFAIKALKENIYLKNLKNKNHHVFEIKVRKAYQLQEELNKILYKMNLEHLIEEHMSSITFDKKIYLLKDGESSFLENDKANINVTFHRAKNSIIEIYLSKY